MTELATSPAREFSVGTDGGLKFSGHESFVLRYGWLPKLHEAISTDPETFSSDERAILQLGLGKNMVKSLRFWGDVLGTSATHERRVHPTEFGHRLLDPKIGLDPYLESAGSLWRLHWNAVVRGRMGAWHVMFHELQDPEATKERLIALVSAAALRGGGSVSPGTAAAHVDILIKAYAASREGMESIPEDALGCPLQELDLLRSADHLGTPTIRLTRGRKSTLDMPAFAFALHDFWTATAPGSRTLSVRSLLLANRSPGRVFALDEASLHEQLAAVCAECPVLELREDGAGGLDLVGTRSYALERLEEAAW